jgi:integrase
MRSRELTLHGPRGGRKYLNGRERQRFLAAADGTRPDVRLFCHMLAWTGGRISEALALAPASFDLDRGIVSIVTLKRRRFVVREVVLPPPLVAQLATAYDLRVAQADPDRAGRRLWPWCRQTGWRHIKAIMAAANIVGDCAMPKGLRHSFAVAAFQASVPPNLVQRWMGHASLETTVIYANVSGDEEIGFAKRMWELRPRGATEMKLSGSKRIVKMDDSTSCEASKYETFLGRTNSE